MRLVDMNKVEWKQLNEDMKTRIGWNFNKLETQQKAQVFAMLESTNAKIAQFKTGKNSFTLQKNPTYNGLLLAKQVLETYLSETSCGCCGNDPCDCPDDCDCQVNEGRMKDQMIGDSETMTKEEFAKKYGKAAADEFYESIDEGYYGKKKKKYEDAEKPDTNRLVLEADAAKMIDRVMTTSLKELGDIGRRFRDGGTLHKAILAQGGTFDAKSLDEAFDVVYDEVEAAHYDAIGHHEMHEATPMMEDEVGAAESLMAAQDMVDRIQSMLEDVGEMLNEQLPPLTDSLRASSGADAAGSFNSSASETLNSLLETLRGSRESMSNAVAAISGGEPVAMDTATMPDDSEDIDLGDDDIELDDFETADAVAASDDDLGRDKRN